MGTRGCTGFGLARFVRWGGGVIRGGSWVIRRRQLGYQEEAVGLSGGGSWVIRRRQLGYQEEAVGLSGGGSSARWLSSAD